jgi:type IV secretion system protein VirB4
MLLDLTMHEVLEEQARSQGVMSNELRPEQWLSEFYTQRKGSGKGGGKSSGSGALTGMAKA